MSAIYMIDCINFDIKEMETDKPVSKKPPTKTPLNDKDSSDEDDSDYESGMVRHDNMT